MGVDTPWVKEKKQVYYYPGGADIAGAASKALADVYHELFGSFEWYSQLLADIANAFRIQVSQSSARFSSTCANYNRQRGRCH